VKAPRPRRKAR